MKDVMNYLLKDLIMCIFLIVILYLYDNIVFYLYLILKIIFVDKLL